jgi:phosphate transport system substrate-binding protein
VKKERLRLGAVAGVTLLSIVVACGGPAATGAPGTSQPTSAPPSSAPTSVAPASTGAGVSGEIFVSGSSTVEPVSLAVSEDFRAANPDFGFTVEGPGTGDGFALFCAGDSDVSDASRAIKDEEAQACADAGIDYTELKIGYDGLTVMTHPDTPLECVNFADLYALFGPESDNFATWADAQALATELGSSTVFPDLPLQITAPGEESGTYDSFIEIALADIAEEREQEDVLRVPGPNYTASPNDNVIVEGVEAGAGALGFVGFAYFEEAGDAVKALAIDGGDGNCVAPSAETIADGSYPISRPLFIYPNNGKADENAALQAWVDYFLSDEGYANVSEVGYVALPSDELQATRDAWSNR